MKKYSIILLASILVSSYAHATYRLDMSSTIYSCPFNNEDPLNPLMAAVKDSLAAKAEGNKACQEKIRNIIASTNTIRELYNRQLTPDLDANIAVNVYDEQIKELYVRYQDPTQTVEQKAATLALISTLEDALIQAKVIGEQNNASFNQTENLAFRAQLFEHMDEIMSEFNNMDPKCLNLIGAEVVSSVLSVASVASGWSLFSLQDILGTVSRLVSNLVLFIKNFNAKKGIAEIVKQQNKVVLACTYYAIQHQRCEYERGTALSKNVPEFDFDRVTNPEVQDYENYLILVNREKEFEDIFSKVSATDISSLDIINNGLAMYISDLLFIENLPVATMTDEIEDMLTQKELTQCRRSGIQDTGDGKDATARIYPKGKDDRLTNLSDETVEKWISSINILTKSTGLVSEAWSGGCTGKSGYYTGGTKEEIVCECLKRLYARDTRKNMYAASLDESKSYKDIKSELATRPDILTNTNLAIKVFDTFTKRVEGQGQKAVLAEMSETMNNLKAFIEEDKKPSEMLADYIKRSQSDGKTLFQGLAAGSMAQITSIRSFIIRDRAAQRLSNALKVIENDFRDQDIATDEERALKRCGETPLAVYYEDVLRDLRENGYVRFTDYMAKKDLSADVLYNFSDYSGTGLAFRDDKYKRTISAFTKGFKREIMDMIETAMSKNEKKSDKATASMLCALFSDFLKYLNGNPRAQLLLNRCEKNYTVVPLVRSPYDKIDETMDINYADKCFFDEYVRAETLRKAIISYEINKKQK
ncbi:MAG: hypothetical protein V1647_05020 [Pseudomonadota bacterium]